VQKAVTVAVADRPTHFENTTDGKGFLPARNRLAQFAWRSWRLGGFLFRFGFGGLYHRENRKTV